MKRLFAILLVLSLLFSLSACTAKPLPSEPQQQEQQQGQQEQQPGQTNQRKPNEPSPAVAVSEVSLRAAESYQAVSSALKRANDAGSRDIESTNGIPTDNAGETNTGTNIQVAGYDEADLVKTDGDYLYILSDRSLQIVRADGANTALIGSCSFAAAGGNANIQPLHLYVEQSVVLVLFSYFDWSETYDEDGNYHYASQQRTLVRSYDVSDPASPSMQAEFAQDGWYVDSRLADGKLYLLSNDWKMEYSDDPATYIPCVSANNDSRILLPEEIYLSEPCSDASFTVISVLDPVSGTALCSKAVTGSLSSIYMNDAGLILAQNANLVLESEPYQENQYTVINHEYRTQTKLMRLSAEDLSVLASGTVDGYLLNSYAMDAYDGTLRLVTTRNGYSYQTYEDPAYGFINYVDGEQKDENALYVLDEALQPLSSLTGLGQDERVYSVRFLDTMAYFVTFRQTDPLFAVDLSNPANPTMQSELKMNGFSSYLHPYGDKLLFGLGKDADDNGSVNTLKLSMFDISDPANVTQTARMVLQDSYSEALNNPHAILVAPERNLIAFPTENGYQAFGYDSAAFYQKGSFSVGYDSGNSRAFLIGDTLYLCSAVSVLVLDAETFDAVQKLSLVQAQG